MQYLQSALDALIGVATDVVVGAAASSVHGHQAACDTAADLRSEVALQKVVGPALYKLASGMSAEVERLAVPRFRSILAHPRRGREQLIDELDNADTEFNTAIHEAGSSPNPAAALRVALAIIRVRAITMALGEQAFADPRGPKGGAAPTPRRREIKTTDLGEDVARAVITAVDAGDQWHAGLEPLRALEATGGNRSGVATKILAFADMPDGRAILERIAASARPHFPPLMDGGSNDAPATEVPIAEGDQPNVAMKQGGVVSTVLENPAPLNQSGVRMSLTDIARRQKEERRRP